MNPVANKHVYILTAVTIFFLLSTCNLSQILDVAFLLPVSICYISEIALYLMTGNTLTCIYIKFCSYSPLVVLETSKWVF